VGELAMRVALVESFIKPWELALVSSVVGSRSYELIEPNRR